MLGVDLANRERRVLVDQPLQCPVAAAPGLERLSAVDGVEVVRGLGLLLAVQLEDGIDDAWICLCGNTAFQEGFYTCLQDGEYVEPVAGGRWDGRLYRCDRCGRLFDQFTLAVVVPPPKHRERR